MRRVTSGMGSFLISPNCELAMCQSEQVGNIPSLCVTSSRHSQIHTIIVGTVQSVQSILQETRNPWFGSRLEFPLQPVVAVRQVAAVTRPADSHTELERKVTRHV